MLIIMLAKPALQKDHKKLSAAFTTSSGNW
jgi:hypothetical protein